MVRYSEHYWLQRGTRPNEILEEPIKFLLNKTRRFIQGEPRTHAPYTAFVSLVEGSLPTVELWILENTPIPFS
jgi:hypothetical protein